MVMNIWKKYKETHTQTEIVNVREKIEKILFQCAHCLSYLICRSVQKWKIPLALQSWAKLVTAQNSFFLYYYYYIAYVIQNMWFTTIDLQFPYVSLLNILLILDYNPFIYIYEIAQPTFIDQIYNLIDMKMKD